MRKLWFRPRSRIVTLVYFNDAQNRTKEHVETLIAFFLRRHWTRSGRALECDALRAITASFSLKPDLVSRRAEIDRKVAAWLPSRDEDRREAAQRYRASTLPRLDP
ncbi:hypothetical protein GCM10007874_27340 [Labrys miyagiensis]|uniref:DUF1376 domain-containing protein n=1 Tax=Labrys miyagiensis TaxID=346912 RepID=A0ABQ6CJB4_9HYPH|nr:hypothetical protein [Labrys miyagiensis]GLS19717.1 hypothetical protein GCM10007874_27340 [Labrys miyagiensis]